MRYDQAAITIIAGNYYNYEEDNYIKNIAKLKRLHEDDRQFQDKDMLAKREEKGDSFNTPGEIKTVNNLKLNVEEMALDTNIPGIKEIPMPGILKTFLGSSSKIKS